MRKPFLPFIFFLLFAKAYSQNAENRPAPSSNAKNTYVEFLGNGIMLSLNYDFRFGQEQDGLGMRFGLGFIDAGPGNMVPTIPIGINYLLGKAPNYLELGLGLTFTSFGDFFREIHSLYNAKVLFIPSIGYRFQPKGKSFTGRIAVTPLVTTKGNPLPFAGLSLGYKF